MLYFFKILELSHSIVIWHLQSDLRKKKLKSVGRINKELDLQLYKKGHEYSQTPQNGM